MDGTLSIEEALELLSDEHKGFEIRVIKSSIHCEPQLPRVDAEFFYLSFRDGLPTLDEFVDYLKKELISFCLPREEREQVRLQLKKNPGDFHLAVELYEKARSLFITAKKQNKSQGEPGELILFLLLESFFEAPQMVSKMYLKTSGEMPVHGTDGIHFGVAGEQLLVYWGESKLYKEISSGLDSAIESVVSFSNCDRSKAREIDIVRDYLDLPKELSAVKDDLVSYFDPYKKEG